MTTAETAHPHGTWIGLASAVVELTASPCAGAARRARAATCLAARAACAISDIVTMIAFLLCAAEGLSAWHNTGRSARDAVVVLYIVWPIFDFPTRLLAFAASFVPRPVRIAVYVPAALMLGLVYGVTGIGLAMWARTPDTHHLVRGVVQATALGLISSAWRTATFGACELAAMAPALLRIVRGAIKSFDEHSN
jgi:hypothetical protein